MPARRKTCDGLAGRRRRDRAKPPRPQARRRERRAPSGCGRRVLVDEAAAMVAIDADRRQVADPGELRRRGDRLGEIPERRVALRVRRDRDQERVGAGQGACDFLGSRSRRRRSGARCHRPAPPLFQARLSSRRFSRTGGDSAARNAPRCSQRRRRTGSRERLFACRRILPKPLILRCELKASLEGRTPADAARTAGACFEARSARTSA